MADLNEMLQKQVLYSLPEMQQVTIQKDVLYKTVDDIALQIDIYTPPAATETSPLPAVIFIGGDAPESITLRLRESGPYTSWGRLVAASGRHGFDILDDDARTHKIIRCTLEFLKSHLLAP